MATWRIFQRGLEAEAEKQFRIYIRKRIAAGVFVGFIIGFAIAYGLR